MSTSEVFQQFYVELVTTLPMDEALFLAKLFARGLLPGGLKQQIKAEKTPVDKATCFLDHKISSDVSVGNLTSFDKLLDVMKDSEYDGLKELAEEIKTALKGGPVNTDNAAALARQSQLQPVSQQAIEQSTRYANSNGSDNTKVNTCEVDFSAYDDVTNAFDVLFTMCQRTIKASSDHEEFKSIRNSCVARASEPLRGLIKRATDTNCLFEILAENNKYCNWINVSFLKVIAIASGNKHLQSLIENYTEVIYSKPLREVWSCIPHYSVRNKYYSKLKPKFGDKDPDNMTVEELIKSKPQLAKKIAMLIAVVEGGSLLVTWLIPTDKLYQAYLSFLTIPQQSRMDELVQFGNWMAYLPKNALQKHEEEVYCGTERRFSELIIALLM